MTITINNNNEVCSGGEVIGSVCYKPYSEEGHWTAYLATDNGDEVVGQYPTKEEAAEAVDKEHGCRVAGEILELFQ